MNELIRILTGYKTKTAEVSERLNTQKQIEKYRKIHKRKVEAARVAAKKRAELKQQEKKPVQEEQKKPWYKVGLWDLF